MKQTKFVETALLQGRPARTARLETDGRTLWLHDRRVAWITEAADAPGVRRLPDRLFTTLAGRNNTTLRELLNNLLELAGHGRPYYRRENAAWCGEEEIDPDTAQSWKLPLSHPYPDDTLTVRGEAVAARMQKGTANA